MIIKPNKLDQAVTSRISFLLGIEQLAYFRKNGTNFRLNSEQDNYVESTLLKFLCPKPYAIKDIKPNIIFKISTSYNIFNMPVCLGTTRGLLDSNYGGQELTLLYTQKLHDIGESCCNTL